MFKVLQLSSVELNIVPINSELPGQGLTKLLLEMLIHTFFLFLLCVFNGTITVQILDEIFLPSAIGIQVEQFRICLCSLYGRQPGLLL